MSTTTAERRVAIVTGAAQGIGEAIALQLADDGLDVAVNDVPSKADRLAFLVEQIVAKGRRGLAVPADISVEVEVVAMVNSTVEALGSLDVMVANAGVVLFKPLVETTAEDWDRTLQVNARGMFFQMKHAAIQMVKQGRGGRIIGAASDAGIHAAVFMPAYSASKFAVRGLAQSAARELRPHGITVNTYAPGLILTEMTLHEDDEKNGGPGETTIKTAGLPADIPKGLPSDVTGVVSFLAGPRSGFISGQCLSVNGGSLTS